MSLDVVKIEKVDEVYIRIICSDSTAQELSQHFCFEVPGHQYVPSFRAKVWDGKIRLFNLQTKLILGGLRQEVEKFCKKNGYAVEYLSDFNEDEMSIKEAMDYVKSLNLPANKQPRDYQMLAFVKSVRQKRRLTLLPTGSGKSLCIYMLTRFYPGKKLIIVPTLGLIHQMASDFVDYNCDESLIHKVFSGQDKKSDCEIWVSTWQSLAKMPKEWFSQFSTVIGDEAHGFKAKTLIGIMGKLSGCEHRFGFSGTLDGSECNELQLTGIFGPIAKGITTSELIDRGALTDLSIKVIQLKHSDEACALLKDAEYFKEMDYIARSQRRNKFIKNLSLSLNGNTLILFQFVEKHGKILYDMIKESCGDRKVFFVYGKVDGEIRNSIRAIVEKENNAIIVASRQTFGTGTNIVNLSNVIFASPLKGQIGNLQAIGRVLRKADGKEIATLFDIADDFSSEDFKNHTLLHLYVRLETYKKEKFKYRVYNVRLKNEC